MFQHSIVYESSLCEEATRIATSKKVCIGMFPTAGWHKTWKNHMRNIRQSMKRVIRVGDVDAAAKDTDLHFCIIAFKKALQDMLDERNTVDKTGV